MPASACVPGEWVLCRIPQPHSRSGACTEHGWHRLHGAVVRGEWDSPSTPVLTLLASQIVIMGMMQSGRQGYFPSGSPVPQAANLPHANDEMPQGFSAVTPGPCEYLSYTVLCYGYVGASPRNLYGACILWNKNC